MKNKNDFIVIGSGGHAAVVIDLLESINCRIKGILTKDSNISEFLGYPVLGNDSLLDSFDKKKMLFAIGIGVINNSLYNRKKIFEKLKNLEFSVPVLKHKSAIISSRANLNEGCQILAGSNIGANVFIGENTIINSLSTIEHDSIIGKHCHIAPGVNICGKVKIEESSFIGAGSTVINEVFITRNCLIGAGSLVVKNVVKSGKYFGHPIEIKK